MRQKEEDLHSDNGDLVIISGRRLIYKLFTIRPSTLYCKGYDVG